MLEIQSINNTTFETLMPFGDKVEIGDVESVDFKPHAKLNRWGNECSIALDFVTDKKILPIVLADKIIWDDGKAACEFLPQPSSKQAKLGGFKFNIILKKKPKTNVSTLKFNAKGLKFYYQPPLTQEFKAGYSEEFLTDIQVTETDVKNLQGDILVHRPENVVGSYAVYHATRTNMHRNKEDAEKYKCGIAFHWFRPLIWDAEGRKCWGELDVDPAKELRTVTIPQDFLDSAVYPVTIDDTFGYTESGESETDLENIIKGAGGTPLAGTGDTIHAYLESTSGAHKAKAALYDADGNGPIDNGTCPEISIPFGDPAWRTFTFSVGPSLGAVLYYVAAWGKSTSGLLYIYYNSPVIDKPYCTNSHTYNSWPASVSTASGVGYSTYCTYTPEGGVTHEGAATLSGVGTLAGIGRGIFIGKGTLSGEGSLASIGRGIFIGKSTLSGIGTLSALGGLLLTAKATLSGMGSLSAIAGVWKLGAATLSGTGSLVVSAVRILRAKATLTGVGSLAAVGRGIFVGSATLAGTGTLSAIGSIVAVGRLLKVVVITSQYRGLNIITGQKRMVKSITSMYRKVKSFTGG